MAQDITGIIIAGVSIVGGLTIGAIAVAVSVPWSFREKLARLEATNKERLALIEKGYDPEQIFKYKRGAGSDPLLWGCLLAGMGLGILLGYVLSMITAWNKEIMTNSMAICMGWIGLIVYHIYRKRTNP